MKVIAKLNNLRIAPRKSKLVVDLIKDMDVDKAVAQLDITVKRSSEPVKKLLLSALANAENNFGLARDNMYVLDARVGAGPTLKRWMPKAFGRAGKILKRTSQITIVLEERVEGKGRKSKEEMEKEKVARVKAKTKEMKKIESEKEEKEVKQEKISDKAERNVDKTKKGETGKSWTSRVFRRKSM